MMSNRKPVEQQYKVARQNKHVEQHYASAATMDAIRRQAAWERYQRDNATLGDAVIWSEVNA